MDSRTQSLDEEGLLVAKRETGGFSENTCSAFGKCNSKEARLLVYHKRNATSFVS